MWRRFSLLVLCCAVSGLDALDAEPSRETMLVTEAAEVNGPDKGAPHAAKAQDGPRGGEQQSPGRDAPELRAESPTAEPLEEELANQENVMSQLLGDYDKVKTVSSGSDCVCRCIVRPIKRSDCSRNQDSDLASQHSYSVETVTKGTDCKKCVCMAPPSAVNPCEGEYRFKKLQEASKDDIKLATIIDLLEGSLYGMDLLKLHSVTTKLLSRVDNMEEALARNFTERAREKERAKERAKEKEKVKKAQQKKKKKNNEGQLKKNQQHDGLEQQQQPTRNKTATQNPIKEKTEPKQPNKDKNSMVVRGVTFYKAEGESHQEEEEEEEGRGKNTGQTAISSLDLLDFETLRTFPKKSPASSTTVGTQLEPTQQPTAPPTTTQQTTTTARPVPTTTITPTTQLTSNVPPTTPPPTTPPPTTPQPTTPPPTTPQPTTAQPTTAQPTTPQPTTTKLTTTSQQTTAKPVPTTIQPTTEQTTNVPPTTPQPTTPPPTTPQPTTPQPTTTKLTTTTQLPTIQPSDTGTGPPIGAPPTAESRPGSKSRLSWTESPADQPKTTKKPVVCKDTLASISEPVQQNSYGFSDGAWMRDGRGHGNVIYLTNGHYGNNLIEFRDMGSFKTGQPSNSYKLPYSFTGTGHAVFNGAFYYNRAFSRDVIRYDLRHRYVAAWTTLHDAILEEQAHRTQSEVQFAVDESGLWLLYPALDTEGFHQEVILLIQLHPRDLQPIQSFRTGLRRGRYGNSFLVCGVLYAVNSMEHHYANVTYAFDTHTLTHTVPSLAFTNVHSHTSQLAYCPVDKKLYAWDNGHQMTYDVIFAY